MIRTRQHIIAFITPFIILGLLLLSSTITCERFEPEAKLKVRTDSIITVFANAFAIEGNIVYVGESEIIQHGFCYAESSNPTLDNGTSNELGKRTTTGRFQSSFSGLDPSTIYNVRAYATDRSGIVYGKEKTFTTPASSLPTVATTDVSNVTQDSAQCGGIITDDGGDSITARGVCWDTTATPEIDNSHTDDGAGLGSFTSEITGLNCSTKYYVRAYATNSAGTAYGDTVSFTTVACTPGIPNVITSSISGITQNSAKGGGNVTDEGLSSVTARGVCWSESSNPTLSDESTTDGSGTGTFTSSLTGLGCNTTYYVRAYVTNSVGTAFGNQEEFTTSQCPVVNPPTVTTTYLSNTTNNSSEGGGNVTDDGGGTITARGVCWSTSPNPTTSDYTTDEGSGSGSYISNITDLTKSTTYYVRAYATNSAETSYGEEVVLRTYEGTIMDYDGNAYWTAIIGSQKWMAENLKVTHFANGDAIPLVEDNTIWLDLSEYDQAYCWYHDSHVYGDIYGALYNWAAVMDGAESSDANPSDVQGVCPDGWHLPSDDEWKQLEMFLGMSQAEVDRFGWRGTNEGSKLKEAGTSHWNSPNSGATNENGFSALPGGYRFGDGSFMNVGNGANVWSTTEDGTSTTWCRVLVYDLEGVYRFSSDKDAGFSVRCVEGQGYFIPTVSTGEVSNITDTSADAGGYVTSDGGSSVLEKGVCWSTDPNPTINDAKTEDGSGTGSFTSSLVGLSASTTYFVRAYAINSVGTNYGVEVSFTTLPSTITDYNGNIYPIVTIGDQVWMAENLKVTQYSDGSVIPLVVGNSAWDQLGITDRAYCWYDDNSINGDTYGALYTWTAASNGESSITNPSGVQGACPSGWHLPSEAEWTELIDYLGGDAVAGGKLKESGTTHWYSPNTGATNESGFTALPGGFRFYGSFYEIGDYAYFLSATVGSVENAWGPVFFYDHAGVNNTLFNKSDGVSVRCVRDE